MPKNPFGPATYRDDCQEYEKIFRRKQARALQFYCLTVVCIVRHGSRFHRYGSVAIVQQLKPADYRQRSESAEFFKLVFERLCRTQHRLEILMGLRQIFSQDPQKRL